MSPVVQTLEECKLLGIVRGGLRQRIELFNYNVRVTPDLALLVEGLGRRVVVRLRVHEEARFHPRNGHRDGESFVGLDRAEILGEGEFARGHVVGGRNLPHRRWVAGTTDDLFPVGDRLVCSGTEVDEVVFGR